MCKSTYNREPQCIMKRNVIVLHDNHQTPRRARRTQIPCIVRDGGGRALGWGATFAPTTLGEPLAAPLIHHYTLMHEQIYITLGRPMCISSWAWMNRLIPKDSVCRDIHVKLALLCTQTKYSGVFRHTTCVPSSLNLSNSNKLNDTYLRNQSDAISWLYWTKVMKRR